MEFSKRDTSRQLNDAVAETLGDLVHGAHQGVGVRDICHPIGGILKNIVEIDQLSRGGVQAVQAMELEQEARSIPAEGSLEPTDDVDFSSFDIDLDPIGSRQAALIHQVVDRPARHPNPVTDLVGEVPRILDQTQVGVAVVESQFDVAATVESGHRQDLDMIMAVSKQVGTQELNADRIGFKADDSIVGWFRSMAISINSPRARGAVDTRSDDR